MYRRIINEKANGQLERRRAEIERYTRAVRLSVARNIAKQLKELGVTVDLAAHFGFIQKWMLIAPFDNTDKKGFAAAYPPEKGIRLVGVTVSNFGGDRAAPAELPLTEGRAAA